MTSTASEPLRVVYLTNFISPDIREICSELDRRLDELTVLVSVPMESNRHWKPADHEFRVQVQKTWTWTRTDRHPSGYEDVNYVHIPRDTYGQLRRRRPHVVISTELGARSMIASVYCRLHRNCRHVIAANTSQHIESSRRGRMRDLQRKLLLGRADWVTHNGPSCRMFLSELGIPDSRMSEWMYAADPTKIYSEPIREFSDADTNRVRLLTVGQLIDRKGPLEALNQLVTHAQKNPQHQIDWTVIGDGPLREPMEDMPTPANLNVRFGGNCDAQQVLEAYRDHEVLLFPTLGDEWGLVVDEALHSGLAVIGSCRAQAVPTIIQNGINGWSYMPDGNTLATEGNSATESPESGDLDAALHAWMGRSINQRLQMRVSARESVADRTPARAAEQILEVISTLPR